MISHFDHAFTFARGGDLDGALDRLRAAGFVIDEQRTRHPGGKLSGFMDFTGTYLELISVVDEAEFAREATAEEVVRRARARPFGVAAATRDISRVHALLGAELPGLPPIERRAVYGDEGGPPGWAMIRPPREATPGAEVLIIEYLRRGAQPTPVVEGDNAIFAVGGLHFCAARPGGAASRWARTFAPAMPGLTAQGAVIAAGPQRLRWLSPGEHEDLFGEPPLEADVLEGSLCGIRLLTSSIAISRAALERAGIGVVQAGEAWFSTRRDPDSGYAFVVEEENGRRAADFAAILDARRGVLPSSGSLEVISS